MAMTIRHKLTAATILSLAVLASRAQAAPPAVLQDVPDNVGAVLVIRDLKDLSTKISNFAVRLSIPNMPPDLLGEVTKKVGLTKGLDQSGSVALFWTPPVKDANGARPPVGEGPPFVMLVPTLDAKAMLEAYKPAAAENGISAVTLPNEDDEQEGFVALIGKDGKLAADAKAAVFVAFAENKTSLQQYLAPHGALAKTLSPDDLKSFETNDLVLFTNVAQYAQQAQTGLAGIKMLIAMQANAGGGDEKAVAFRQRALEMYFDFAKLLLTDTQTSLLGLRLGDAGITLGTGAHFKADGAIAKFLAAQKPLAAVNLDGLPQGNILGAFNMAWDPATVSELVGKLGAQLTDLPELAKDPETAKMKKAVEIQKQMMALTSGGKFALYETAKPMEDGFVRMAGIMNASDPIKYLALMRDSAKNNFGAANPSMPELQITVVAKDNALTVKGPTGKDVSLDKYTVTFALRDTKAEEPSPEAEQALKMIHAIYGKNGLSMYAGALNATQVVFVVNADDAFAQTAATAAVNNAVELTQGPMLAGVRNELLANPNGVALLPVDRWVDLGIRTYKNMMGGGAAPAGDVAPVAAPVPPAGACVAISAAASPTGARVEVFVPMATMTTISEQIKRAIAEAMGGGMMVPPPAPPAQ